VARPRILLVPALTELEWRIKPRIEEWAEVASFDLPGVGDEPPVDELGIDVVVERGLAEVDDRGWDRLVVAGDEYGTYGAAKIAAARPDAIRGLALGHACLSFRGTGDRAPVNGEVMGAMRDLEKVDYRAYARHLTQVTQDAYDDEVVEEYIRRVPQGLSRSYELGVADADLKPLIASVDAPLLFAKHDRCLGWTDEGWEDAVAAFPKAKTLTSTDKPSVSPAFAEALRELCSAPPAA
jgi:pimeloyl-ACP methyl ester carboxylesterase